MSPVRHSFLPLSSAPLCAYTTQFLVCVDGHLSCFYPLAVMNAVARNISAHVFVQCFPLSWVYPSEWECWVIW